MKRVLVLAAVLLFGTAAAAQAQERKDNATGSMVTTPAAVTFAPSRTTASTNIFSRASLERAVVGDAKPAGLLPTAPPRVPRGAKSWFKSPWLYIIAGGVIAAVIIAVNTGDNGSGGGIY